jgi:flagellar motility protein MotE (MotC chaperone)
LEELLPKCIGGIFRNARALRIEKEAQEQRELERQRRRAEEAAQVRRNIEEKQRMQNLDDLISNWQKAQQIRTFMDAYEKVCEEQGVPVAPESKKGEWIMWARKKADRLGPLKP